MNYLLHLLLSQPHDEHYIGNMIGDFVKGPLDKQFTPRIMAGLRRHRNIDSFAEQHQAFRRSKRRIDPSYGHYRGIMVDLFYDHFTARNWQRYCSTPLDEFAEYIYQLLSQRTDLPPQFSALIPRMIEYNWLVSYRQTETISRALTSISQRIRRTNPLASGADELLKHYTDFERDCHEFIIAARQHQTR